MFTKDCSGPGQLDGSSHPIEQRHPDFQFQLLDLRGEGRLLDASFEQVGMQPTIIVEMNSIEGILATVRTSRLATILPRLSMGLGRNHGLRGIPLTPPTPRRGIGLLWKKGGYRSGGAQALADQVKTVVKKHWR